jgi:hypothetical protein
MAGSASRNVVTSQLAGSASGTVVPDQLAGSPRDSTGAENGAAVAIGLAEPARHDAIGGASLSTPFRMAQRPRLAALSRLE